MTAALSAVLPDAPAVAVAGTHAAGTYAAGTHAVGTPGNEQSGEPTVDGVVARRIVVRPAPRREPPFDDELPARHLALVGPHDRQLPFEDATPAPSPLRLLTPPDQFAFQPTGRAQLPAIESFTRRFIVALIEVAGGRRSPMQLSTQTSAQVHSGLMRDRGPLSRLGTPSRPARIHSVHVCEPADGVAEVAVILALGGRFRAMALRLEGLDGRWRCTRLQIG